MEKGELDRPGFFPEPSRGMCKNIEFSIKRTKPASSHGFLDCYTRFWKNDPTLWFQYFQDDLCRRVTTRVFFLLKSKSGKQWDLNMTAVGADHDKKGKTWWCFIYDDADGSILLYISRLWWRILPNNKEWSHATSSAATKFDLGRFLWHQIPEPLANDKNLAHAHA